MHTKPFRWSQVTDTFDQASAEILSSGWPSEDFWEVQGKVGKSYSWAVRPLVVLGHGAPRGLAPLAPAWEEVVRDLQSPRYRESLSELTGVDLENAELDASFRRWGEGAHLGPHLDMPSKLLTHIVYFESDWMPDQGGCLRILGSDDEGDVVSELPPLLGTSSVLVRSESSWHSVSPVRSGSPPRRSLQIIWMPRGSESPVFRVRGDGSLAVRAEVKFFPRLRTRLRLAGTRNR